MSQAAMPVLEVSELSTHLTTKAGIIRAVDQVSFRVMAGQTVGLVGESGCGKSMTALSIMRLLPRPAGRIVGGAVRLRNHGDLTRLSERAMRRIRGREISMIFQEPMTSLNPVFTIGRQIVEAIRAHDFVSFAEARTRAVALMGQVGIPEAERRFRSFPHQLSGGMRQRVMIAMALACRPMLMLADEPTTALDVTIQAQILQLMNRLKRETGTAILLITHDLGVVAQMAQEVCVMYAGRIVEAADVKSLFARPAHPYTRGLLDSVQPDATMIGTRRQLKTIGGSVPSLSNLPPGCRFSDRCAHAEARCRTSEPPMVVLADSAAGWQSVRCWLHV